MKKIQMIINIIFLIIFVILLLTNINYNKFHTQITETLESQVEFNDSVNKIHNTILKILSKE